MNKTTPTARVTYRTAGSPSTYVVLIDGERRGLTSKHRDGCWFWRTAVALPAGTRYLWGGSAPSRGAAGAQVALMAAQR